MVKVTEEMVVAEVIAAEVRDEEVVVVVEDQGVVRDAGHKTRRVAKLVGPSVSSCLETSTIIRWKAQRNDGNYVSAQIRLLCHEDDLSIQPKATPSLSFSTPTLCHQLLSTRYAAS